VVNIRLVQLPSCPEALRLLESVRPFGNLKGKVNERVYQKFTIEK
jgi:hypothetical protein